MNSFGLTQRQIDLLAFLASRERASMPSPSFEDMARHLGLSAKSGVYRLVTDLEQRGHLVRLRNKARSIRVVDRQFGAAPVLDEPRITVPAPVADRLDAYCRRRRLRTGDVLSAALDAYMEGHPCP